MESVLLIVHVLVSVAIIGLVLIQHGKGADAGAAFGSGASATVFGSQGSGSFLSRSTAILATVFFVTSLSLAYLSSSKSGVASVLDSAVKPAAVPTAADVPASGTKADVPDVSK